MSWFRQELNQLIAETDRVLEESRQQDAKLQQRSTDDTENIKPNGEQPGLKYKSFIMHGAPRTMPQQQTETDKQWNAWADSVVADHWERYQVDAIGKVLDDAIDAIELRLDALQAAFDALASEVAALRDDTEQKRLRVIRKVRRG
jgi:hypothetical protein